MGKKEAAAHWLMASTVSLPPRQMISLANRQEVSLVACGYLLVKWLLEKAGRQAGKQHLLVTWTGAKTTEFP